MIYTSDNEIYEDETAHALGVKHPSTVDYSDHLAANPVTPDRQKDDITDYLEEQRQRDYDVQGPEAGPSFVFGREGVMPKVDTSNFPESKNIVPSSLGEVNPPIPVRGKLSKELGTEDVDTQVDKAKLRDQFRESVKNRSRIIPTAERMSPLEERNNPRPGRVIGEGGGGSKEDSWPVAEVSRLKDFIKGGGKFKDFSPNRTAKSVESLANEIGIKEKLPRQPGAHEWTSEKKQIFEELKNKGLSRQEIADALNTSRSAITNKFFRLGLSKEMPKAN